MTLKRLARASKFRKKKPWEAAYPWTITSVGESSLLSKVTVLMNRGSLLAERNHLTLDPGGPEPILTCSWTWGVLELPAIHHQHQNIESKQLQKNSSLCEALGFDFDHKIEFNWVPYIKMSIKKRGEITWQERGGVSRRQWCDRWKWESNEE